MQIVVDGLMTHYETAGKGKLVLFLHGWGDNLGGLANIYKALSDKYKVLAVDLPGFGGTEAPAEVWNLDNYSKFLNHFLNKLEAGQLFAVVGHSNGGAMAIRAISIGELEPKKLVLLAASGIREGNSFRRFILKVVAKTGNVATLWMPERYRQDLRKALYGAAGSDMLVAPHLKETFKKSVRQDVKSDAANVKAQTLLIYGSKDRAVPLEHGQRYQSMIKHSRLEVIEGAGHFVQHEQPERVIELIEGFLK